MVYVARHAEKEAGRSDPGLTRAGQERAETLARLCETNGVSAVYSTPYLRSVETARPVAERCGVGVNTAFAAGQESAMASEILDAHRGRRVLVVGHSNTLAMIVTALGGDGSFGDLRERVYDTMYVVTVHSDGRVETSEHRYGRATP